MNEKKIICAFCAKDDVDNLYYALKKGLYHFAVVYINNNYKDFYSQISLKAKSSFLPAGYDAKMFLSLAFNENFLNFPPESETDYSLAIIIAKLPFMSQKMLISYEYYIHRILPDDYCYLFSYHSSENEFRKFPVYSKNWISENSRRVLLTEKANGYGDSIISMPVLSAYAESMADKGYETEVWHYYDKSYNMAELFLGGCINKLCKFEDSRTPLSQIDISKLKFREVKNLDDMVVSSAYTKVRELSEFIFSDSDKTYKPQIKLPELKLEIKEKLEDMRKNYKYIAGVQFDTLDNNVCTYKRRWSLINAEKFIKMCHMNSIGVINLDKYSPGNPGADFDAGKYDIPQIFSITEKLDIVIGIDSCCCHIAGIMGKYNLTIWGKILKNKSQRALSQNYSIISGNGDPDSVPPETVIKRTMDILTGKIDMRKTIGGKAYDFKEESTVEYLK